MKRCFILWGLLLTVTWQTADAGVLYARRPGTEAPLYNLVISHIRTNVTIVGQMAVTHVDEEFFNDNNLTLEGFYAFQLPQGAKINGLWLWENGNRLIMVVKKKEEAYRLYDSVVLGTRRDPALLEELGANRFQVKVFPIPPNSSRRIEIRYFYPLPLTPDGYVHYRYPLNMLGYQSVPVETTSLKINVSSKQRIEDLETSFDGKPLLNRVTKNSDFSYSINFGLEQQNYGEDYTLRYKPEGIFDIFPALSYVDTTETPPDPYFMAWHPVQVSPSVARRDLTFVLDASGSMYGNRIASVKSAVKNILTKLSTGDRFRIVLFSSNAISDPADGSFRDFDQSNVDTAGLFIDRYYEAVGGTNYEAAFIEALNAQFRPEADKRMLFLTDGEPTMGKTTFADLIRTIEANDPNGVRIYPILFYTSIIQLLHDIALARGGKATSVDAGDNLETVIGRIMLDLELTGIEGASVKYPANDTYLMYPLSFPPVVPLEQLITTGRAKSMASIDATLSYRTGGNNIELTRSVDLPAGQISLKEVASYWGAKRIDDLLDQIKRFGETKELKESVINMSIKYQVLSPYTAFLVLETNPIDPPPTGIDPLTPSTLALTALYPNPAVQDASVIIAYRTDSASPLRITITDMLGRVVRTIELPVRTPGEYNITWDGLDELGIRVPSGMYFIRLQTESATVIRKLLVQR